MNNFRFLWLFEILNFLINHDWFFWLIGRFNKKKWIKSIFLSYPANDVFEKEYAYKFRIGSWKIRLTAFLRQNKRIIIMFTVFLREDEFLEKSNNLNLKEVVRRLEKIRLLVGADEKTFAGILPGLLVKRKIIDKSPEAELTASIIIEAISLVKDKTDLTEKTPIVVLGARGFIGKRVMHRLKSEFFVHAIDLIGDNSQWPEKGKRKIIVNIARHDSISFYLNALQRGDVVINEAYPAPGADIVRKIKDLNADCFHVAGVKAVAFPRFTQSYEKGIPCCAAWNSDEAEVIIKKLT